MKEKLLGEIIDLLAPGEINKNFMVVTVNEKKESIIITFEEMANLIPQGLQREGCRTGWFPKPYRAPDISVKGQDSIFIRKT